MLLARCYVALAEVDYDLALWRWDLTTAPPAQPRTEPAPW
jgi:hypothetical protein